MRYPDPQGFDNVDALELVIFTLVNTSYEFMSIDGRRIMAVDYAQVREAFIEARGRALPARLLSETQVQPEREWDPLEFPTWWVWLCETADTFKFWVDQDERLGKDLAASTWNRLEFCQTRTANTDARYILTMVAELGIGNHRWADAMKVSFHGPAEDQSRELIAQLACRVLDELAGSLSLGE